MCFFSMCLLSSFRRWFLWGQCGHLYCGSLPHSKLTWRTKFLRALYVRWQLGHVNPLEEAYWAHGKPLLALGMSLFNSEFKDFFSLEIEYFTTRLRFFTISTWGLPTSPCVRPSKFSSANQQIAFESKNENKWKIPHVWNISTKSRVP